MPPAATFRRFNRESNFGPRAPDWALRIDGGARHTPLTMPTRLLPILFFMFGVQSSTSMLTMRVSSLPHLKTPGGRSCSSRRLPLAMTLVPGSMSSIPGGLNGDSARDNRTLEFSEAARDSWPPASALETSETRGAAVDEMRSRSVESHLTPGPILASVGFGAATLAAQACFTDWAQLERDAAAVWSLLPPEAASGVAGHEVLALFPLMYITAMSFSFFGMQGSFPPQKEEGTSTPKQVPLRNAKMVKHRLAPVDFA